MARPNRAVEPVIGEPAATVSLGEERALLIADYHAGIEAGLRYERGVELSSNAESRRQRLLSLVSETGADRVVVVGDLGHQIGDPGSIERDELTALYDALVGDRGVSLTIAPGNHDSGIAELLGERSGVTLLPATGGLLGEASEIGVAHGHTWPDPALLSANTICIGHEHPQVKLEDSVGGYQIEQVWVRGEVDPAALIDETAAEAPSETEQLSLVILPAFNKRSGGTWINTDQQGFLAPFLPAALQGAECYLLDGTRLGPYRSV